MSADKHQPEILAIDAGGTLTDTIVIDADGGFTVGKAQTSPKTRRRAFATPSTTDWGTGTSPPTMRSRP